MNHWAKDYIGKPHARNADGPDKFSCWGLVRHVFRTRHSVELPPVAVGEPEVPTLDNVRAIKAAAQVSGFRRVSRAAQDGDVVLMRNIVELHCGLVVRANNCTGVLHSSHGAGVVWQPWWQATDGMGTELWSRGR